LTGKPFAHFWFHSRFLLVEGEKMSKSLGNFFTLRDLVLKGHKPSSIRYLLASVPYRNQLNFTFDGLKQAAVSVERLRNFQQRLLSGRFPAGTDPVIANLAQETLQRMQAGMDDDLNTAQAQAAIFDMVRKANVAIDAGQLRKNDAVSLLQVLERFDELFAVLKDEDAPKIKSIVEWAQAEGRGGEIDKDMLEAMSSQQISDAEVQKKIAAIDAARRNRDFKTSDSIRAELAAAGIAVEITKDGVRWKRK
jgi:cysteinyl-tRNA synthetase